MQFMLIAYDATDENALERRMASREKHFEQVAKMKTQGQVHMGGALLDDNGKMIGSTMVLEFPDRKAVDAWLEIEPYVTGKVWEKIQVLPYKIAPLFIPNPVS